jgi:antitoxin CptB
METVNRQQLVWRCRRGVRELDVLLTRFLDEQFESLPNAEKVDFVRFLETQDPVIMDWLFGKYPCEDPALANIVTKLQTLSGIANQ